MWYIYILKLYNYTNEWLFTRGIFRKWTLNLKLVVILVEHNNEVMGFI